MLAEQTEKYDAPTEPIIKPMAHNAFVDDFSLESAHGFALVREKEWKWPYHCQRSMAEDSLMRLVDPDPHKRRFEDLLSNSARSMISKLERMDKAPTKKRHY